MKIRSTLFILLLSILFPGCSATKQIEALKPEPSNDTPVVYKTNTSFIDLPVTVTLADIEAQLNKNLNGLIYEDNNIDDDKTAMKIWKTAPIKLTEEDGKLESVVPFKVTATIKYGTSALGLDLYDTKEVNLDGVITLSSTVGLSNWKMTTSTVLKSLDWSESPTVTVAGKKIAITYIINSAVKLFKSKIEKKIDDSIAKSTDFKPYVLDALEKLSAPFETSPQYEAWFKLNPTELYVTDAVLSKKLITMEMGLKCTMQTIVGQKPKNSFKKEDIVLKAVSKMPDRFTVSVAAISSYENASRVITKNFQGQEFGSGKKKVVVQKVSLWSKEGKMIVALDLTGSINGTIYLTGYPNYNAVTKDIYFDKMEYVLNTKSLLMRTANWLAEGIILRKIQENCRYSITGNMEEGKKNLLPYLSNYSPMPGVFINGTLDSFEFDKIELNDKAIIAFINANGKMDMKIDGMK